MIKTNTIFILSISIILCSCVNEIKTAKPSQNQVIKAGEWYILNDSTKGISVRENKFAFFENMKFSSEDIYEYSFVDSVKKVNESETKFGEYLVLSDFNDTIYHKILERNDSILSLDLNGKAEKFTWSKPIIFREKKGK